MRNKDLLVYEEHLNKWCACLEIAPKFELR